jgi:hypothetical protein
MALHLHQSFNGTLSAALNVFASSAKAAKWAETYGVLAKGHVWVLVNSVSGELNELNFDLKRTVKPMGWGFKPNWEDKKGRKATNLTVYVPKTEFRRV